VALDQQVSAAEATLRDLQSQKGKKTDAINAQKAAVASLQAQLASVQAQISAIDGTIANGGCLVPGT
jgi:chromosome segregation ATPase